jgi:hypothetical protein
MFVVKARSLPYSGAPERCPASPEKISLGWKVRPEANALAYYEHSYIIEEKNFYNFGQGPKGQKF